MSGDIYVVVVADINADVMTCHKVLKAFTHLSEAEKYYEEMGADDVGQKEENGWGSALRIGTVTSDTEQYIAILPVQLMVGESTVAPVAVAFRAVAPATILPIAAPTQASAPIPRTGSYRAPPTVAPVVKESLVIAKMGDKWSVSGGRTYANRGKLFAFGGKWDPINKAWNIPMVNVTEWQLRELA